MAAIGFLAPGAALLAPRARSTRSRARHVVAPVRAAMVRLEFTPADGSEPIVTEVTKASVLRDVALGEKVELYQGMNKLLNCGGIGNCGTCTLRVT